ncbi:MAG: 4-vinyl reductase [Chloroflexi bacterium]|nr:4-vinyl reductase [Chloroflexota bacterium]
MTEPDHNPPPQFYYANRMGRVVIQSLEQVIGKERLEEVLAAAGLEKLNKPLPPGNLDKKFPFEHVSGLMEAIEKMYGEKAGHALQARVGRTAFGSGLKEFDPVLGIADLPLRLMPLGMKFRVGLDVFQRVFNQFSDQVVRLSEDDEHLLWIIERCPVCWGRHTDVPCCYLALGILDESVFWGTGGKRFKVEEVTCIAKGDETCTFAIDRQPVE